MLTLGKTHPAAGGSRLRQACPPLHARAVWTPEELELVQNALSAVIAAQGHDKFTFKQVAEKFRECSPPPLLLPA
jgi:hypothetical protein